ncbi:MAG TPA: hypothetical protein VGJ48_04630 [Pyrinomonadaceae bacterium]
MKSTSSEKRTMVKKLKSSLKALTRATVLGIALLLSSSPAQAASNPPPGKRSIRERVELVRETLKQRVAKEQIPGSQLSFSERALAQWGNWGNWGNWNNWVNWNNWNNWRNWGNWGNWGNV